MTTIVFVIVAIAIVSTALTLSACMLSSRVSQNEERKSGKLEG